MNNRFDEGKFLRNFPFPLLNQLCRYVGSNWLLVVRPKPKKQKIDCVLFLIFLFVSFDFALDLNLARRYEASGQLALAKAIYQAYLTEQPFNPSVYSSFYRVSFGLGEFKEFLTVSQELLKKNPNSPEIMVAIGEAYLKLDNKKLGVDYCRQALALNSDYIGRVIIILRQANLYSEAIRLLLDYRKSNPHRFGYELTLIDLYEAVGDYTKATQEIVQFINKNPAQLVNLEPKLKIYLTKANPASVLSLLSGLSNRELKARLLSKLYLFQKRYGEALAVLKSLNSITELNNFAHYCEEQEEYQMACQIYQELEQWTDAARVLRKLGKLAEATEVLKQESSIPARLELANLQVELRDYRSAKENYLFVIKQRPSDEAYYGLVKTLIHLGQLNEAKKYLNQMVKKTDQVLFFLIQIYFYEAVFDSCQKFIEELSRNFPTSPFLNDALSIGVLIAEDSENLADFAKSSFNLVLGNYDEGIRIAQKLIQKRDKIAEHSFLLLAEFYLAQKEPNLALSALKELQTKFPNSTLLPKAKLEEARIYEERLKDVTRYQRALEELIVEYPNSVYSSIARNRLAKLQKPEPSH
ncbi:MAG: tetratricopeptide repeat protein [candidate division WOR-3 bacterium]